MYTDTKKKYQTKHIFKTKWQINWHQNKSNPRATKAQQVSWYLIIYTTSVVINQLFGDLSFTYRSRWSQFKGVTTEGAKLPNFYFRPPWHNLYLHLSLSAPTSSVPRDRTFSAMRRINNYIMSTMFPYWFSKLFIITIKRDL